MFQNLKIGKKILIIFLSLFAFSVFIISYIGYSLAKESLINQIMIDLRMIAEGEEAYVNHVFEHSIIRVVAFSSDGFIRDSAKNIINGEKNAVAELNNHLVKNKKSLDPTISEINVLDLNGKVVASTLEEEIGKDYSREDYFLKAKELNYGASYAGNMSFLTYQDKQKIAFVSSAVLTEKETDNKIGIIANYNHIDIGRLGIGGLLFPLTEMHDFEVYLVNKDGFMITDSRFMKDAILKQKVESEPVKKCDSKKEITGIYKNYVGLPVFGASMCLDNGLILLVEITEKDALVGVEQIKRQIMVLGILFFIVIGIIIFMFVRQITKPLKLFNDAVKKIGSGDVFQKIKIESRDEIGSLAESFNDMTMNLSEKQYALMMHTKFDAAKNKLLSEMIGELELYQLEKTKGEFISIASHQLRTPLTSMKWLSDLVLSEHTGKLTAEQRELIVSIRDSNERLISLVRDLLNASKLSGGRFQINPKRISLIPFFEIIFEELESQIKKKNHNFIFENKEVLPEIYADQELLKQAFHNLLMNAIKYTKEGGKIILDIKKDDTDTNIIISIKDNGIGISESFKKKLFDRFVRTPEAVQLDPNGTGLGLYIAKKAIEAQGGNIWFESEIDKGTIFFVSLPIKH